MPIPRLAPARAVLLIMTAGLALSSCQSADPFCRTHNAADLTPTRAAYEAMSTTERRAAAARFNEAALRCRWEP